MWKHYAEEARDVVELLLLRLADPHRSCPKQANRRTASRAIDRFVPQRRTHVSLPAALVHFAWLDSDLKVPGVVGSAWQDGRTGELAKVRQS